MQLKHILQSVKTSQQSTKGHNRNNYAINVTNQDRTRWGNNKFKLMLRDNPNGYTITKPLQKTITKQWLKQGGNKETLHRIGFLKALTILKEM